MKLNGGGRRKEYSILRLWHLVLYLIVGGGGDGRVAQARKVDTQFGQLDAQTLALFVLVSVVVRIVRDCILALLGVCLALTVLRLHAVGVAAVALLFTLRLLTLKLMLLMRGLWRVRRLRRVR